MPNSGLIKNLKIYQVFKKSSLCFLKEDITFASLFTRHSPSRAKAGSQATAKTGLWRVKSTRKVGWN